MRCRRGRSQPARPKASDQPPDPVGRHRRRQRAGHAVGDRGGRGEQQRGRAQQQRDREEHQRPAQVGGEDANGAAGWPLTACGRGPPRGRRPSSVRSGVSRQTATSASSAASDQAPADQRSADRAAQAVGHEHRQQLVGRRLLGIAGEPVEERQVDGGFAPRRPAAGAALSAAGAGSGASDRARPRSDSTARDQRSARRQRVRDRLRVAVEVLGEQPVAQRRDRRRRGAGPARRPAPGRTRCRGPSIGC